MLPQFSSRFVDELPADRESQPGSRQVFGACYSHVEPTKVAQPSILAHSTEVAAMLGLGEADFSGGKWAEILGGNLVHEGMKPHAACYGGHQFGNWAGQLGDGRAISLGEVQGVSGPLELQLKGAGPTPYSRRADGRAVMRSSVREFLCSEAMAHLGVPTTRALSLVSTGEQVVRDMLYDGNARPEPGAVVCRVAPSFIRFGNFEIFNSRGDVSSLRKLVAFTIRHFYPHLLPPGRSEADDPVTPSVVAAFFREVCEKTALMVVEWMRVGFVHGVMNTDNMSIMGLTIDYGPYGWLEDFDPTWTPNTTDAGGRRYRFGNQPRVCEWNLVQLGNALVALVGETAPLEAGMAHFTSTLHAGEASMMAGKLGLSSLDTEKQSTGNRDSDRALVEDLNEMLMLVETDMTIFYRSLANLEVGKGALDLGLEARREPLEGAYYDASSLSPEAKIQIDDWLCRYIKRTQAEGADPSLRRASMNRVNPKFVLRNYLAAEVIEAAEQGDGGPVMELLAVLRHPYDEQEGQERFCQKRPEWARNRPGCSMLSCSS